jgi:hypothetical protein
MAEGIRESSTTPQSIERLSNTGFEEMQYWFLVSRDKFDLDKFREQLGPTARNQDAYRILVAPTDPKTGDYHIHAGWRIEENEITFWVKYVLGPKKHEKDEREPYAEQFMEWLGRFFRNETAQAHIHADFEFPLETRQSKFPLPLKTALEGGAEIDGISLRLPALPSGVSRIRLTQGKTNWFVEVIADRRVKFKEFTPYTDVQAFLSVIGTLMEERKS